MKSDQTKISGGLRRLSCLAVALVSVIINLTAFYCCAAVWDKGMLFSNAFAWTVDYVCSFLLLWCIVRRSSPIGQHTPLTLYSLVRMFMLLLAQIAFFFIARSNAIAAWGLAGAIALQSAVAVLDAIISAVINRCLLFNQRFHAFSRTHLITSAAVVTAILNYTVFYLSKLLLFGIDYYMFADMAAWLLSALYFFTVTRDLVKAKNGNADIVFYLICLFGFLLSHMIIRFSYGTLSGGAASQKGWIIDVLKPVLVVVFTSLSYLIVRFGFPRIKRIDENTAPHS